VAKQVVSFRIYWCQNQDIFWVFFPEVGESLTKIQRAVVAASLLFMQLLFQTSWAKYIAFGQVVVEREVEVTADFSSLISTYAAAIVVRIISADFVLFVVGLCFKPLMRCISRPRHIWHDSESILKQWTGKLASFSGFIVFLLVFGAVIISMLSLLNVYTCNDFIYSIFVPFFATLIASSIFPGIIKHWFIYKIKNTWGERNLVEEQEGFLSSEP